MTMARASPASSSRMSSIPGSAWPAPAPRQAITTRPRSAETLRELVDFKMINEGSVRFSVGAVNVVSGNFVYFDNRSEIIGPEHVMASGALPPALPMVKIGTDYFWDGGIVSNTPLQHLLDQDDKLRTRWSSRSTCSARAACCRATWPGCAGAPQGHHVFVAHPLQHRRLPAHPRI